MKNLLSIFVLIAPLCGCVVQPYGYDRPHRRYEAAPAYGYAPSYPAYRGGY
jgi:hypothetical protein